MGDGGVEWQNRSITVERLTAGRGREKEKRDEMRKTK